MEAMRRMHSAPKRCQAAGLAAQSAAIAKAAPESNVAFRLPDFAFAAAPAARDTYIRGS
jgi:hypothetical protein